MSLQSTSCAALNDYARVLNGRSAAAVAGYDPRTDRGSFGDAAMTKADTNLGLRSTRLTEACRHAFETLAKCAWPENFVPGAWIIE